MLKIRNPQVLVVIIETDIPRDRISSFEPRIIKKNQPNTGCFESKTHQDNRVINNAVYVALGVFTRFIG